MLVAILLGALATVCYDSEIMCYDDLSGRPWVYGSVGCAYFFAILGGDPGQASCDVDGRCKYQCGLGSNLCDMNQGCVAGTCLGYGCTTSGDCVDGNPWDNCNKFEERPVVTYALPSIITCTLITTFPYISCTGTFHNTTISFCKDSCVPECSEHAGVLPGILGLGDTCIECDTGATCTDNPNGYAYCDTFSKIYLDRIRDDGFPGNPIISEALDWDYNKCVPGCDYFIADTRVGIYVGYTDLYDIDTWYPIGAPAGRPLIAEEGFIVRARPGLNDINQCAQPLTNLDCAHLPGYFRSIATMMDDFYSAVEAAYCVDKCPQFVGGEAEGISSCRFCAASLANGCQYREDDRQICDSFVLHLPGDPYNVTGLSVCTDACRGAVNGSGWTPCASAGGCCVRCDPNPASCLWRCSNGPKCVYDAFSSPYSPGDQVGACAPMCDVPIEWQNQ